MREPKYRAWRKKEQKMHHIAMLYPDIGVYILQSGDMAFSALSKEIELLQCIGLKDKNGNEVCEGDIVRLEENAIGWVTLEENTIGQVVYDNDGAAWAVHGHTFHYHFTVLSNNLIEVIGNVYDNPELIGLKPA